jgi:hypothetical protein
VLRVVPDVGDAHRFTVGLVGLVEPPDGGGRVNADGVVETEIADLLAVIGMPVEAQSVTG